MGEKEVTGNDDTESHMPLWETYEVLWEPWHSDNFPEDMAVNLRGGGVGEGEGRHALTKKREKGWGGERSG